MSDALTCTACQKRYVWKKKYAGQRVKCPCGQLLLMPRTDPNTQVPEQAEPAPSASPTSSTPPTSPAPFELVTDELPAPSRADRSSGKLSLEEAEAAIAVAVSAEPSSDTFELAVEPESLEPGPKLTHSMLAAALTAKPSKVAEALMNREDELQPSPWKEKYIPASVAIIGVMAQIVLWVVFAGPTRQAAIGAAVMLLAEVLLLMPIAIGAVFVTARVMNIGFGPMVPALLKVAAIAIGTGGVADLLFFKMMFSVDFEYVMLLVVFVLHLLMLGLPMLAVFELELMEMAMIVSIVVVPRILILFGMGYFFPHWF